MFYWLRRLEGLLASESKAGLESQLVQGEPSGKWARNEGGAEKDYGLWAAGKQEYSRV